MASHNNISKWQLKITIQNDNAQCNFKITIMNQTPNWQFKMAPQMITQMTPQHDISKTNFKPATQKKQ